MKKAVSLILCLVLISCSGITTFAAELQNDNTSAQSTVLYHVDSYFCVIIPETIDAYAGFQLSASSMNITDMEQVNVYINGENSIQMENTSGDTFNLALNCANNGRVAQFVKNQLTSDNYVFGERIDAEMPPAGDYTGTVEFLVRLESREN